MAQNPLKIASEPIIEDSKDKLSINSPRLSKKTSIKPVETDTLSIETSKDEKVIKKIIRTPRDIKRNSEDITQKEKTMFYYMSVDIGSNTVSICIQERSATDLSYVSTLELSKYELPTKQVKKTITQGNKKIKNCSTILMYRELYKELIDLAQSYKVIDFLVIQRQNIHNIQMHHLEGAFIAYAQIIYANIQIYLDLASMKYEVFDFQDKTKKQCREWCSAKTKDLMKNTKDTNGLALLKLMGDDSSINDTYVQLEASIIKYDL